MDETQKKPALPEWVDLKFLILLGTILFAYAGFHFTTKATLDIHSKELEAAAARSLDAQKELRNAVRKDELEHEKIKLDVTKRYEDSLQWQSTVARSLGGIDAKLESLANAIKHP